MQYNPDFIIIPFLLVKDRSITPLDREVYGIIYWAAKLKDEKCTMLNATIAELLQANVGSIKNSISRLAQKRYISVQFKNQQRYIFLIELSTCCCKSTRAYQTNKKQNQQEPTTPTLAFSKWKKTKEGLRVLKEVIKKHGLKCFYCSHKLHTNKELGYSYSTNDETYRYLITFDHIIAQYFDGLHTADNLVPSCRSCNSTKGIRFIFS